MNQITTHATAASRTVAMMILATPIRKDMEGRYCLNDLHKAAGEDRRHQPANYLRLETTAALSTEISKSSDVRIKPIEMSKGRYGGTYVHEDIVMDYAAWISPAFKLEVYRGFKASRQTTSVGGQMVVPSEVNYVQMFRMALQVAERNEVLEKQIEAERPLVAYADATMADERTICIREAGKQFGFSDQRLMKFLIEKKVLFRQGKSVMPYQRYIDDGQFTTKSHVIANGNVHRWPHVTGKGLLLIDRLRRQALLAA